jgi:hypothetical protein
MCMGGPWAVGGLCSLCAKNRDDVNTLSHTHKSARSVKKFNGWPIRSPTHAHITPADVTISETGKIDNNRIDLNKFKFLQGHCTSS